MSRKTHSLKDMKRVINKIHEGKKFLVTTHMNPEGDALGSALAVYILLKKLNKDIFVYNQDKVPNVLEFLPFVKVIKNKIKKQDFDVAIVLDCSDSLRAGTGEKFLDMAKCVINIDHHVSNTYFGDINWVEPLASSTAQLLYRLHKKMKIMDKNIALCLYTGIVTDSGNFTYTSTDSETHRVASDLLNYNLDPNLINRKLHSLCAPEDLNCIGKTMSELKFDRERKICWATVEDWQNKNYDHTEVIFSIMRLLKDPKVLILFKKVDDKRTRINFRSNSNVDVNRIAKVFGGGGHRKASGATVNGGLFYAEKKVIAYLNKDKSLKV